MHRKAVVVLSLVPIFLSSALLAKKKVTVSPKTAPTMTADQKALHALNRLTFGPRPEDIETVQQKGLDHWIEQQLHPSAIPENPVLETKLAPFDTLRMTTAELAYHYPTPQMVKAMIDGKEPFPSDPDTRYLLEKLIARFQRKEAADKAGQADNPDLVNARAIPETWQLDDQQKQVLQNGKPPEQAALIESMPPAEQYDVLDSLNNNVRQKLYPPAPPDLRRKIQIFNGPIQVVNQDMVESKLLRAVYSDRQLEEVLTDFWYNHFNVFLDKGADRYMVTTY